MNQSYESNVSFFGQYFSLEIKKKCLKNIVLSYSLKLVDMQMLITHWEGTLVLSWWPGVSSLEGTTFVFKNGTEKIVHFLNLFSYKVNGRGINLTNSLLFCSSDFSFHFLWISALNSVTGIGPEWKREYTH